MYYTNIDEYYFPTTLDVLDNEKLTNRECYTGLVDKNGNDIMKIEKRNPVGFVTFGE